MNLNINAWDMYVLLYQLSTAVPFCWDLTGPWFPLQNGRTIRMYCYDQSSLNCNTYTEPGDLYWRALNLDGLFHPLPQHLSTYLHSLSVYDKTSSVLGEFAQLTITITERSGSLCKMVVEWMPDPTTLMSLSLCQRKKPSWWKADPPESLTFISQRTYYSSCRKKVKHDFSLVTWTAGFI